MLKSLRLISRTRGLFYMSKFILSDFLGNQLGFPMDGHKKELLFWEKQIVGLGNFSRKFPDRVDRSRQKNMFPKYLLQFIESLKIRNDNQVISVLDVGAGPVSLLTWAHHQGLIKLTTSDILSKEYLELLIIYGRAESVEGILVKPSPAEQLANILGAEKFHMVFCNNALDHMDSPILALLQMVEVAIPGGIVVISGHSREGTKENWDGIHNHDLYIENRKLMRSGREGKSVHVADNMNLETIHVEAAKDKCGDMVIVYRKN